MKSSTLKAYFGEHSTLFCTTFLFKRSKGHGSGCTNFPIICYHWPKLQPCYKRKTLLDACLLPNQWS